MGWFGHPSIFFFFFLNKIYDRGILGKKAKDVELPQFESLGEGGLSVTFETLKVKVQIGGYFRGVKCNFT
jgi:hypothetical protein